MVMAPWPPTRRPWRPVSGIPRPQARTPSSRPGVYQVPVADRYWTGFNRMHPLDGPAREQAWNGTVHGLFAELGVGATTHSSLQLAHSAWRP